MQFMVGDVLRRRAPYTPYNKGAQIPKWMGAHFHRRISCWRETEEPISPVMDAREIPIPNNAWCGLILCYADGTSISYDHWKEAQRLSPYLKLIHFTELHKLEKFWVNQTRRTDLIYVEV